MTVSEMLWKMSKQELVEWMAFYQLEPWGTRVDDQRFGVIAATTANVMSSGNKQYTSNDFFPPRSEPERKRMVAEKVKSAFRQIGGAK